MARALDTLNHPNLLTMILKLFPFYEFPVYDKRGQLTWKTSLAQQLICTARTGSVQCPKHQLNLTLRDTRIAPRELFLFILIYYDLEISRSESIGWHTRSSYRNLSKSDLYSNVPQNTATPSNSIPIKPTLGANTTLTIINIERRDLPRENRISEETAYDIAA